MHIKRCVHSIFIHVLSLLVCICEYTCCVVAFCLCLRLALACVALQYVWTAASGMRSTYRVSHDWQRASLYLQHVIFPVPAPLISDVHCNVTNLHHLQLLFRYLQRELFDLHHSSLDLQHVSLDQQHLSRGLKRQLLGLHYVTLYLQRPFIDLNYSSLDQQCLSLDQLCLLLDLQHRVARPTVHVNGGRW